MSKLEAAVARKISLRQDEEETLKGTRPKSKLILF